MKYIKQFAIIMGITCLGELIKYLVPLPIPGSIYGLVILFLLLLSGILKLEQVKDTGEFLVAVMPVMFIPAAVGLMDSVSKVYSMLIPILIAVVPITFLVMIVAGKVTERLLGVTIEEKRQDVGKGNE